jgi:tartrate-resistant acid phosphatase type 5
MPASPDPVTGGQVHLLMVGDWGEDGANGTFADQSSVANAMQAYAAKYNITADALLMLGDNFYGSLTGAGDPRWQSQFEKTYPASVFPGPAYAIPGNHDYQVLPVSKYQAELQYAQLTNSRWAMPSQYYQLAIPATNPLVNFIALDSNMPNEKAQPIPPNPSFYTMTDANRQQQLAWLTNALAQPTAAPFTIVVGHHPLYSNGRHGDNQTLIRDWGPLFQQHGVHLYVAGHDHDLQHLEISGLSTSFFMSGAGGESLYTLVVDESVRGPYSQEVYGFSHVQVRPDIMIMRHLDTNGNLLHKFTKTPAGVVTILK